MTDNHYLKPMRSDGKLLISIKILFIYKCYFRGVINSAGVNLNNT